MSEDVIRRPRPVIDPALPAPRRDELRRRAAAPHPLAQWSGGDLVTRRARLREAAVHLLAVGGTLALALATAGWYLGMAVVNIGLVAHVAALALRGDAHPATRAASVATGAGALAAIPVWLLDLLPGDPAAGIPWGLFGVLVALVSADALTSRVQEGPSDDAPEGSVILPDDLSEADHAALCAVQRTIDVVERAREAFGGGDSLDTDRALAVLRDQEWRIAVLLARQRELRRAHLRRWQRADSPRVREALRPQREHLCAVEDAVQARVEQIVEYGRLVERAVAAHREWEQCQEAADSTAAYAEHRAAAAFLGAGAPEVSDLAATAEAARRIRDEHVERLTGHSLLF
ncbi:hypothetical protein ACOQFV_22890 [Nocardiopsis changdeensis]|uniref:Integral membrane protein n=1 Tax=Nocardiopsis changdeensis TaxID=2831969 RepID=A0ABX8BIS5_9ACTN|nr:MULTISPECIES: hypothetical protein [Nocardiopsis]QUX21969.1 hypothetical protein KGD84_26975 [Nocardiopsis changdeensis]QYX37906.1 hypothetical protein K1J57_04370 [Nocardiopsis sp. MT53]